METTYREGDLVQLVRPSSGWTILAVVGDGKYELREYPVGRSPVLQHSSGRKETPESFEGKCGLIVKVDKNHLDQPQGYRVLIGENTWFCKSIVAEKYFYLLEKKGDESR